MKQQTTLVEDVSNSKTAGDKNAATSSSDIANNRQAGRTVPLKYQLLATSYVIEYIIVNLKKIN